MDERVIKAQLRREMGKTGWALLIYYLLMNAAVLTAGIIQIFVSVSLNYGTETNFVDSLIYAFADNGWGYMVAIAFGLVLMLLWKKKEFCFHTIWKSEKNMSMGSFFAILAVFLSGQLVFSVLYEIFGWLFNLFGLSVVDAIESASFTGDSISMFLYMGLLAPIAEEILFRGLLLRMLRPYGKRFAILSTAFLFGIFHGNIIQSPYAFLVGLVLGYVALEYSIGWSMVLHTINNLLVVDSLSRLSNLFLPWVGELVYSLLFLGSGIAAIIILFLKRKDISVYRRENPMHPWCVRSFFASSGVIVFTVVMALSIVLSVTI